MAVRDFKQISEMARAGGKRKTIGVLNACDVNVLEAVESARDIADAILIGDPQEIREKLDEAGIRGDYRIEAPGEDGDVVAKAAELVHAGEIHMLMKGKISTGDMFKGIFKKETGLRGGQLMSHLVFKEIPGARKIIGITDGALSIQPSCEDKKHILSNALDFMHGIGYECPNVAVLCAIEKVNPKMQETVASIKLNGVMVPGLARPEKDGNGYEIVAGHRRCRGSELAGLEEMPFIVRDMTDHEAVEAMKDSNKQRDQTLPSELAALLDLEVEDIKHQGSRLKNVAEGDVGKRSVEIVGEAHGMNYKKVMRYLRLNHLVPELMDKVDDKKMGFMPAVELSYIKPKNQRLIAVSIDGEQASPSLAQAKQLRELDKEGKLNGDVIDGILSEKKKEDRGVIISMAELEKYFGKEATPAKMKEQIMTLLDEWKEKQPPELAKAPKKMEKDK